MKESAYNLCARDAEGNYYLFNTRRGAAHIMVADTYQRYWASVNGTSPIKGALELVHELADKGFLVDNDVDELSEIVSAHDKARQSRERIELLIAPSMACNLDCFYCFESNRYAGRMTEAVQENTVRLVRCYFESGTRHLDVTWYGGEPLLAFSAVEHLSKEFLSLRDEFGCGYSAVLVTNGTLMTRERARQLASWQVKRAQITLDGVPEQHDARRVPKNGSPTFFRVLEGIEAAAAYMHVTVRINACRQVAARLEELLQILAERGLNKFISIYVAALQKVQIPPAAPADAAPARSPAASPKDGKQWETLDGRDAADLEIRFNDLLSKYGFAVAHRLPEPRCTTCMADKEHSWLIEANGDVQKCYWTAGIRSEAAGRLTESGIALQAPYGKWRDWTDFRSPDCLKCIMLPVCLGRCPFKHVTHGSDYCLSFKHNWLGVLARSAGLRDARLVPVQLPLAGEKVKELASTNR